MNFAGDDIASLEGYANIADKSAKNKWNCSWAVDFDDGYAFTSPVGKFKPNGFGLYDTTGNVHSWCADWYDHKLYEKRKEGVTDPKANTYRDPKARFQYRVVRGGCWSYPSTWNRSAIRIIRDPSDRDTNLGFRVCFVLE